MSGDTLIYCRDAARWHRFAGVLGGDVVPEPGQSWRFVLFSDVLVFGERKTKTKFGTERIRGGDACVPPTPPRTGTARRKERRFPAAFPRRVTQS